MDNFRLVKLYEHFVYCEIFYFLCELVLHLFTCKLNGGTALLRYEGLVGEFGLDVGPPARRCGVG